MFDYNRDASPDLRSVRTKRAGGIVRELFTYATPFGYRRAAEIIRPENDVRGAAILYVHWLESDAPDSNRTQFIGEAEVMAKRGAVALLIETMWSERDWFIKRTQADDYENSRRQVIELRQALDLLLAQPGVDANRVAYVGHDFGAMYGVVLGSVDPRATCYVLMAGTPLFPIGTCIIRISKAPRVKNSSHKCRHSIRSITSPSCHPRRFCFNSRRMIDSFPKNARKNSSTRRARRRNCAGTPRDTPWIKTQRTNASSG
jgi:hypothetical protein